jgi:cytochrome c553
MKSLPLSLCLILASLLATNANAEGDIAAGKAKSAICATCHGADGKALLPVYPNLAGQNQEYMVLALKAYRSKQRQGGNAALMHSIAANLSDDDINNLAAYFASMK